MIYRGGDVDDPDSGANSNVKSRYSRNSVVGDVFYVGGHKTGETWPWHVNSVGVDEWYGFPFNFDYWARNVTEATKGAGCLIPGDSGGSVFAVVSGGVKAAGTVSGIGAIPCTVFFTDIYRSYLGLPGNIATK